MKHILILVWGLMVCADTLAYEYAKKLPLSSNAKRRINRPFDATFERYSAVNYDYVYDWTRPSPNSVHIRLKTHNKQVANEEDVWIEVQYRDMRHSKEAMTAIVPMTFDGTIGVATINRLEPATVYEFGRIVFYRGNPADKSNEEKRESRLASRRKSYYSITDGDPALPNFALARARRNIVMGAFKEYHDWQNRGINYRHKPWYTNGNRNWCGDFVRCLQHEHINVDHLDRVVAYTAYQKHGAIWRPKKIKEIAQAGHWVHGDFLKARGSKIGGHRGLLITYDQDTREYVYIDGNNRRRVGFNRTRRLPFDSIGHITPSMVRTEPVIQGVPSNQFSIYDTVSVLSAN